MIHQVEGNILEADVEALVNTVNTVGVMGKGIALQFKRAFPEMFDAYQKACKQDKLSIGRMQTFDREVMFNQRYIINFPTKRHWKGRSRLEDIEAGLRALVTEIEELDIKSIAIPPLGCGHGGLIWEEVYPRIESALNHLHDVQILVYRPAGAPAAEKMVNRTERPLMTPGRASIIEVLNDYCILGYEVTLLEVHKLAYFLQEAGESLRLQFHKKTYGPYADNLRHVLNLLEGHFLQGFGAGENKPKTVIRLLDGAAEEARQFIAREVDANHQKRLQRVFALIEGFESPYGMELLASVHWVNSHDRERANDLESTIAAIHGWNTRKRNTMKPPHVRTAWKRLTEQGWLVSN